MSQSSSAPPSRKIAGTQLEKHAPRVLFGRETELENLDKAWAKETLNVYTLVAWGGAGKTSLVFHWVQTRFAEKGWPGVERYFDWSFYSQGTGESRQTSADLFISKALEYFGDPDPTRGGPHERGERLAGLIRQHRSLLILDGIEPLQYPPNDPQAGRLKDPALEALLREVAADNPGLVVITTREHLTNVKGHATAEEQKLDKLAKEAAVSLLRHLKIVGTDEELHAAWRDAGGHALTLSLLGRFIADAYEDRDIRHYREVNFAAADQEGPGRSAFKVMIAYERWLQSGGPEHQRELAVLRLTGLFDRPMAKSCLDALRTEPSIPGLTDALVKLTPQQWNIAVKRLSEVELLSVSSDAIDAHPLIREYFAAQLRQGHADGFRTAHRRLYDHLCETTPDKPQPTIEDLQPLYQAVAHGCFAGLHQEAMHKVILGRIQRGNAQYSTRELGAFGSGLSALASLYEIPWTQMSITHLPDDDVAWVWFATFYCLRALGRMTEAINPIREALTLHIKNENWTNAAICSNFLGELELALGDLPSALKDLAKGVAFADLSGVAYICEFNRSTHAHALHQAGRRLEAVAHFRDAENMKSERQLGYPLKYSMPCFQYCDLLLSSVERRAWQTMLGLKSKDVTPGILTRVSNRVMSTQQWVIDHKTGILDIAINHLTLARAAIYAMILDSADLHSAIATAQVDAAVDGFRRASDKDVMPLALLTRALLRSLSGTNRDSECAQKDLHEAWEIAERGAMRLYIADIHLHRARMFRDRDELAKAAKLIRELGYGRRYAELEDAEEALK